MGSVDSWESIPSSHYSGYNTLLDPHMEAIRHVLGGHWLSPWGLNDSPIAHMQQGLVHRKKGLKLEKLEGISW